MRRTQVAAPLAAILSALASLGCCLPLGFVGALGAAGAGVFLASVRPWLLGLSAVLVGVGFLERHRATRCGAHRGKLGLALLLISAAMVLVLSLFPQTVAALLAGR
jgi:hypothetical protein